MGLWAASCACFVGLYLAGGCRALSCWLPFTVRRAPAALFPLSARGWLRVRAAQPRTRHRALTLLCSDLFCHQLHRMCALVSPARTAASGDFGCAYGSKCAPMCALTIFSLRAQKVHRRSLLPPTVLAHFTRSLERSLTRSLVLVCCHVSQLSRCSV